jgi:hypothetical protein
VKVEDINFTQEHSDVLQRIVDDMTVRLDALAGRANMPTNAMLQLAGTMLFLEALKRGACRTNVLRSIEVNLEGQCPCDVETMGNA